MSWRKTALILGVWFLLRLAVIFIAMPEALLFLGSETVLIGPDGTIYPPTANITSADKITYYFNGANSYSIVVKRSDITIDGNGYTLQGPGPEYAAAGFCLSNINNVTIRNMSIKNFNLAINLTSTSHSVISRNNITNNDHGIHLTGSSLNVISGNSLEANEWGNIWLYRSSGNDISGNNMRTSRYGKYGVHLDYSSNNTVSGNNLTDHVYTLELWHSSNNSIFDNNIANNGEGIGLYWDSLGNNVSQNNVTDNYLRGIHLYYSANNTFSGNNIANNWYGIECLYSSNNNIYHNTLIENTHQFNAYDSVNMWDDGYPSGGNYWSDYVGQDKDGDGIGDIPYIIDENNRDRYPLMR